MAGGGGQRSGGGTKRTKKNPLIGAETVRQFNQRLHRDGTWDEYESEAKALMAEKGLTMPQAREQLAVKYGAAHGVLPMSAAAGFQDKDGSYLDTMNWVATALGWLKEGRPVSRLDAPGPKAWAMFQWAGGDEKSQDKFWALWTQASKRPDEGAGDMAVETQAQEAELEAMLDEIEADDGEKLQRVAELAVELFKPPYRGVAGIVRVHDSDAVLQERMDRLSDALLAAGYSWEEWT